MAEPYRRYGRPESKPRCTSRVCHSAFFFTTLSVIQNQSMSCCSRLKSVPSNLPPDAASPWPAILAVTLENPPRLDSMGVPLTLGLPRVGGRLRVQPRTQAELHSVSYFSFPFTTVVERIEKPRRGARVRIGRLR